MNIREVFDRDRTSFSLEIFPPKRTDGIETIYKTLDDMVKVCPDYISITYGAGGSTANSLTTLIAADIKERYGIEPLPHLTCIHNTREQIDIYLDELQRKGITNVLALRGDRQPDREVSTDFHYASELVEHISRRGGFNIVGACYPEGHPEAGDIDTDIENLKIKVDAGVTHLNSQLFFDNNDFYAFLDKVRQKGIDIPIEAGIMPVINKKQIERVAAGCGASLPAKFTRMMARYGDNAQAIFDAGIAYAVDQIVDLITSGVDGIHLYSMNRPQVAQRIIDSIRSLL